MLRLQRRLLCQHCHCTTYGVGAFAFAKHATRCGSSPRPLSLPYPCQYIMRGFRVARVFCKSHSVELNFFCSYNFNFGSNWHVQFPLHNFRAFLFPKFFFLLKLPLFSLNVNRKKPQNTLCSQSHVCLSTQEIDKA